MDKIGLGQDTIAQFVRSQPNMPDLQDSFSNMVFRNENFLSSAQGPRPKVGAIFPVYQQPAQASEGSIIPQQANIFNPTTNNININIISGNQTIDTVANSPMNGT